MWLQAGPNVLDVQQVLLHFFPCSDGHSRSDKTYLATTSEKQKDDSSLEPRSNEHQDTADMGTSRVLEGPLGCMASAKLECCQLTETKILVYHLSVKT